MLTQADTDADADADADTDADTGVPQESTVTLVATEDAIVRRLGASGDNTNYGQERYNSAHAWTNSSSEVVHRSLIAFDLSSISSSANITLATLKLFSDSNSTQYPNGHDTSSGSNACRLARITADWDEMSVTWNNQPNSALEASIEIPQSTFGFEDKEVNVTQMVQAMVDSPDQSFGFHLILSNETPYRRMVFASIDHSNPSLHPLLEISYID